MMQPMEVNPLQPREGVDGSPEEASDGENGGKSAQQPSGQFRNFKVLLSYIKWIQLFLCI